MKRSFNRLRIFICVIGMMFTLHIINSHELYSQLSPPEKESKNGNFGMGFSFGDPTGLSFKYFIQPKFGLQWHVGWMPLHHWSGGFSVDFLWHPATIGTTSVMKMIPYFGGGLGCSFWDDSLYDKGKGFHFGLALRMLGGLAFHWEKIPIDTVVEMGWTPHIFETNPIRFSPAHGDISIKSRYYF